MLSLILNLIHQPMVYSGRCNEKERRPIDNLCTTSSYGRIVHTYPDQDLRTYPGVIRNTLEWDELYKKRCVLEQTINYFKEPMSGTS